MRLDLSRLGIRHQLLGLFGLFLLLGLGLSEADFAYLCRPE